MFVPNYDYSKLRGKMTEKGYNISTLAKAINLNRSTLSQKLSNKITGGFSQKDMENIGHVLGINSLELSEYFFTKIVDKSEQNEFQRKM